MLAILAHLAGNSVLLPLSQTVSRCCWKAGTHTLHSPTHHKEQIITADLATSQIGLGNYFALQLHYCKQSRNVANAEKMLQSCRAGKIGGLKITFTLYTVCYMFDTLAGYARQKMRVNCLPHCCRMRTRSHDGMHLRHLQLYSPVSLPESMALPVVVVVTILPN